MADRPGTAEEFSADASDAPIGDAAEGDVFDVIVIGAGPPGENLAERTRAAGLRTAVVERDLVGGECSYWACMPSKALLRPSAALAAARAVPGAREAAGGELAVDAVLASRNAFASDWQDEGQVSWLESVDVELVRGQGRLAGPREVVVTAADGAERRLVARHAVALCTGSRPALPPLPGMDEARPWTSHEATSSQRVPERLAVVGGGVVGVEMASAWRSLGASVTLLVRGDALLPQWEPFAGELVAEGLASAGVEVRTGASVAALRRPKAEGPVVVELSGGNTVIADEVLFATGRRAHTEDLGLETVGLSPGDWLSADDSLRVEGVPGGWLYCAGDVNHRAMLTHQGKYQARIAASAIVARARGASVDDRPWGAQAATADRQAVPQVVFTHPEAASVGLTLASAEKAGLRVRAVDHDMGAVAGAALFADGYRGRARLVVDEDRQVVVGASFVGPAAGELLHAATIAVAGEVPLSRLWHAVPAYPTISEVWLRLLEAYRG
ncbi:dihydrolipoyl dehydrogenase family protein [Streptomyces profundus]|uniref:dihydrolipoyl dehydrogenase family protein n=1 Tax=Streptomyces profundus TaxID=2867410 RepID=UPI001D16B120|nr:NAD(P)/FAD-dependent oxidoreductase [Streptomyces sp. MA3_2.13]UED83341.1 NAD(P)/FAD-dependent oxidoreductase [Streptomyces sp. MA3_2.13]